MLIGEFDDEGADGADAGKDKKDKGTNTISKHQQ